MDLNAHVLWVILGAGLVTVVPRVLPLLVLSRVALPDPLLRWLGYIPVAVLAALLAQSALLRHGRLALSAHDPGLYAAALALLVAARWRSMLGTVLAGVVAVAVLRRVLGG